MKGAAPGATSVTAHSAAVVEMVNGWRVECNCGAFGPLYRTQAAAEASLCPGRWLR